MKASDSYVSLFIKEIAPILKENQFTRRGRLFTRDSDDVIHMVDIQRSVSSTSEKVKLTSNAGTYSKFLGSKLAYDLGPKSTASCHLMARIGYFLDHPDDYWWVIDSEERAQTSAIEIRDLLNSRVMPLINSITSTENVHEWLLRGNTTPFSTINPSAMREAFNESL